MLNPIDSVQSVLVGGLAAAQCSAAEKLLPCCLWAHLPPLIFKRQAHGAPEVKHVAKFV
jgi:hypothetical protein